MSTIGRTNSNTGSVLGRAAILQVIAPTGSTVTISSNNITKILDADSSHISNDRPTVAIYMFVIPFHQFGTWLITTTKGIETNSTTVTINSLDEYTIYIGYHVPIGQYQEVEYIENTGSSWINPNVAPAVNFSAKLHMAAQGGSAEALFGINLAGSGEFRSEIYTENNHYALYSIPSASTKEINHAVTFNELVDMTYSQNSNSVSLTIYGITVTNSCSVLARQSCSFFRFAGAKTYYQKGRINHAEIYNNGVLVRDMWSCYRLNDSVAGMWDKVSQTFFVNQGSGTFVVGSDVI